MGEDICVASQVRRDYQYIVVDSHKEFLSHAVLTFLECEYNDRRLYLCNSINDLKRYHTIASILFMVINFCLVRSAAN